MSRRRNLDKATDVARSEGDDLRRQIRDLISCCNAFARELGVLDKELRPRIDPEVLALAEASGVDVRCLSQDNAGEGSVSPLPAAVEVVRGAIGSGVAVNFGPRRGLITVTFERVTEETYRVRMPTFWAVFKNGSWHRGPGILRLGAIIANDEVGRRIAEVMLAVEHNELEMLGRVNGSVLPGRPLRGRLPRSVEFPE